MINPNEICEKKFEKSKMFGYKIQDVDNFIMELSKDYSELHKEKNQLEQKVDFLADKLTEYRQQEGKITDVLVEAKKVSDNVIKRANEKAEAIISEAKLKSNEMLLDTKKELEKQQNLLMKLQKESSDFKNKLLSLYKSHIDLISTLPAKEYEIAKEEKELSQETIEPELDQEKPATMKSRTFSISLDRNGIPIKIDEEGLYDTKNIPLRQDVKKVAQRFTTYSEETNNFKFKEPLKFGEKYNFNSKTRKKVSN